MDLHAAFEAHPEAAEAVEPRERVFYHPAIPSEGPARLDTALQHGVHADSAPHEASECCCACGWIAVYVEVAGGPNRSNHSGNARPWPILCIFVPPPNAQVLSCI